MIKCIIAPLLILSGLTATALAGSAPKQLYNKSILINWVEQVSERAADGRVTTPTINSSRTVYVSSAGRLFVKGNRNINNRNFQGNKDIAVGPERSGGGSLNFQGDRLVGTAVFDGGARQLAASFASDFSSCSASVVYGKAGGAPAKWKGFDGVMREMISVNVGSVGCSVRDGNALAQ